VLVKGSDFGFPGLLAKIKTDTNLDRLQGKVPRGAFLLQARPLNTRDSIEKPILLEPVSMILRRKFLSNNFG
jgi:hypothetical protein